MASRDTAPFFVHAKRWTHPCAPGVVSKAKQFAAMARFAAKAAATLEKIEGEEEDEDEHVMMSKGMKKKAAFLEGLCALSSSER